MEYKLLYSPEKLSSIKSEKLSSSEEKWEIGNTIDNKYEIQEILAEDENKIIYRVRHCQWNIHLAVRSQTKKEEQARFFSQAERWVNLEKHPNIVSAYYTKTAEDISRLFVEYVRAKTLVNFRNESNLDIEAILDIAIQLGWGMNHAHSKGLLHGDLRPGNIFITDNYEVKISDFRLRDEVSTYTPYMAPEQFDINAPLQHTVDMYAYGIILYEMCLGELPFKMPGKILQSNNIEKYKTVAMTQPPRNPSQVVSEIPKAFSDIVMSCISPNPEDRPRDFAIINEAITNLYEDFSGFKYPREEPQHDTLMAIDLNNRALALIDLGEEVKAEQYLQDAVDSNPECTGAVINLELLRLRKKKNTISHLLSETTALLEVDPQVVSYYRVKICLEYGGFLEEALEELNYVLSTYPHNKELINLKSSFLERLGKYEEAISLLKTFVSSENHSAKDHFNLGKCYLYLRKFKSAQEAFEKGCSLFESNHALKLGLGLAMAHRGKVKEAQEHFEKMVVEKNDDFWATLQLAEITSAISKYIKVYGKATQDYEKAKVLYSKLWELGAVPRVKYGFQLTHGTPPTTKGNPISDRSNWRYTRSLSGHDKGVQCVAISPDDRFAIAGGDTSQIFVWDIATGKNKKIFDTDSERITDLRISHDGHFAISIGDGNIVDVWDLIANQRVCQLEGHVSHITCLELTKTGYIATGSVDKTIRIWDLGGLVCHKVLKGHKDKVLCLAVTPCGQKILSGGEDHSVGIWNIETGECFGILSGHSDGVNCIAVSTNGKYAVSASWDQTLRIWDIESGKCLQVLSGHSGIINAVTISSDSSKIISAGEDKNIFIWDAASGLCIKVLEGHTVSVTCLKIAPQTQTIVSGSWDYTIKMWDMDSGECLNSLEGHTDLVNAIAMTSDESYMLSGGDDPVLRVWKDITTEICPYFKEPPLTYMIESPKLRNFGNILEQRLIGKLFKKAQQHIKEDNVARSFELFREIQEMGEFEKNNRILEAIASTAIQNNFKRNKTRKVWNSRTLNPHKSVISTFASTSKNEILAAASYDGSISLWNVEEMKKTDVLKGHNDYITSIDISPNKRFLISGSRDNTIRLWELQTGQCIHTLSGHKHWVEKVKFSNDGRKIISGSRDGCITIWETKSGDVVHNLKNHTDIVNNLEVLPNSEQIISASHDRSIRVWDVETGKCLSTLERHRGHISSIAIVPGSPYIVSGGWDHVLYLWDTQNGSFVRKFYGHTSWISNICVSNDGKTILSTSLDKTIRVWELETGQCRGILENHDDDVTQVLITPDDRFAITASYDNNILIWDIQNCECCDGVTTTDGRITSLIMLEEGRRVLTGTANGNVAIWEIDWEWEIPYEYEQATNNPIV
ncbi:protein kinase [Candidatus Uabimicrobium sp. HlEnr_7]|uniref:protein kinase domain-containing protein n=1 Tax=Candidatus Uabimicrobium helgolandensis TaxID=3095367 RepID=UPI003557F554